MSTKTLKTIGRKLRETRESHHLTQLEVATKSGIGANHYAQIERGEANPTIFTLNMNIPI